MIVALLPVTWSSTLKICTRSKQYPCPNFMEPVNVTLCGSNMVKLRILRWEVIFDDVGEPQMEPQGSSQEGGRGGFDANIQRRKPCEDGSGRHLKKLPLKVRVMQPQAEECSSHQKLEEVRKSSSLETRRGACLC